MSEMYSDVNSCNIGCIEDMNNKLSRGMRSRGVTEFSMDVDGGYIEISSEEGLSIWGSVGGININSVFLQCLECEPELWSLFLANMDELLALLVEIGDKNLEEALMAEGELSSACSKMSDILEG